MAAFEPFEPCPLIAVGVSGGPDSMALALLAENWAKARGGQVLGLTVDHGLRPESAAEARRVGEWLAARGIAHAVLAWEGLKPASAIQQGARDVRYALLSDACAARGILHLAVGHHADDQAETVLLRQQRGSGPDGLAGMAAVRSLGAARLVRPLLGFSKASLIATCASFGQDFIDDPSNSADRYGRTAARRQLATNRDLRDALLRDAARAGGLRATSECAVSALLARVAELRPDGSVALNWDGLRGIEPRLARSALTATLRMAGGGAHASDAESIERMERALAEPGFRGASLGGCLVRPSRGKLMIFREPGRVDPPFSVPVHVWRRWDGRFLVRADAPGFTVRALGRADYARLRRDLRCRLPAVTAAGLPAFARNAGLVAVPALGWREADAAGIECRFAPLWPLSPEMFTVVCDVSDIICVKGGGAAASHSRSDLSKP